VAIIDPDGLFGGDRLRQCSNAAQLHWPRLFLASNGFARLEINYAKIIGRAYPTFNPIPSGAELQTYIQDYQKNYLLFLYQVNGQMWGQWDTRSELLPRHKTSEAKRSPAPPEPAFSQWKQRYREESKAFPKCFGNVPEIFLYGVGVGDGKNICASPDGDAHAILLSSPQSTALGTEAAYSGKARSAGDLSSQQETWFSEWWREYWVCKAKKAAREAFAKYVKTADRFQRIMAATRAQRLEMLGKEEKHRPHGATWLNGERWDDETCAPAVPAQSAGRVYETPVKSSKCK
jgi:hypothetical protein